MKQELNKEINIPAIDEAFNYISELATKAGVCKTQSKPTGFYYLSILYDEFHNKVDELEGTKRNKVRSKEYYENYRKVLSPILDGTEEKRLMALKNQTCVSINGGNETISMAAEHCYNHKCNVDCFEKEIVECEKAVNRKGQQFIEQYRICHSRICKILNEQAEAKKNVRKNPLNTEPVFIIKVVLK